MNQHPSSSDLHHVNYNVDDAVNLIRQNPKILHAPKVDFKKEFTIPSFSLSSSSITECLDIKKSNESIADLSLYNETSAESLSKSKNIVKFVDFSYNSESEDDESEDENNKIYISIGSSGKEKKSPLKEKILTKLMKKTM